jgi:Phage T4 tail fibre
MKSLSLFASLLFTGFSFAQIYTPNGTVTGATTNATTNNIGIGITAPLEKLDVVGNIKTTGAFKFSLGGTITADATWIKFDKAILAANILRTDNQLQVGANGIKFLVNPTTGNVGIGTTTPAEKLDVAGNAKINGLLNVVSNITATTPQKAISIVGPNIVGFTGLNSARNLSWDFAAAGSAVISSYRGGSWGTYLQFLTNNENKGANAPEVRMHIADNGNVGIGTTTPGSSLVVAKGTDAMSFHSANGGSGIGFNRNVLDGTIFNTTKSAWQLSSRDEMFALEGYNGVASNLFAVLKNGNVGIGTATPTTKLAVDGDISIAPTTKLAIVDGVSMAINNYVGKIGFNTQDSFVDASTTGSIAHYGMSLVAETSQPMVIQSGFFGMKFYTDGNERMRLLRNGNIGIGTATPDEKLTVKGKIHTNEVRVDVLAPIVPDYVFEADYKLKNLNEVATFIKENKHLPEVPSAKEMEQNGLMLAEMNLKLLKKIEELTLYAIDQNKEIATLQERLAKIEAKLK